ncbi:MAG TPA: TIGR00341 family protein [Flavobacteriales bacterium]|nr:TIGR00341 family protein [Flavobacteriales bacterium]
MNLLRLLAFFRLGDNAEDPRTALEAIARNVEFRGTNLMILVFAIIIASVGLNVNSAAVVIGAMLISPLMGPIVGVGAGLGVMNLDLVRRAVKHLAFAAGASVVTSTLYFLLTPLGEAHSEILARTTPTIWDVLIAASGGFAGIIAAASKDRGNVVPGVAIATALMPPLCTAGYGLAHANWAYFFGAFYLFLINSVFIALATLATVRWLGYPLHSYADEEFTRRMRRYVTLVVLVTVLPSIYLAWRLVQQSAFNQRAQRFITAECTLPDNFLVERAVDAPSRTITLTYMGEGPTDQQEAYLNQRLKLYDLQGADLQVRTGLLLGKQEEDPVLQQRMDEQRRMMGQLAALQDSLIRKDAFRSLLQREAQAVDTGIQWLVVMDVPGRADSLPQLVSARFDQYPDSTRIARLQRWINTKFDKPGQLIIDTLR